jgi:hypothetical protein
MSDDTLYWAVVLQGVVLVLVCLMLVGLIYVVTELRRRAGPGPGALVPGEGLAIGARAPVLAATDARNGKSAVPVIAGGRSTVMAFLSPKCSPCVNLVPGLNRVAARERGTQFVAVVPDGKGFDFAQGLSKRIKVLRDEDGALAQAYKAGKTPMVYLIGGDGKIAMRAIPNTVLDLDHALEGIGREQGDAPWVTVDRGEDR